MKQKQEKSKKKESRSAPEPVFETAALSSHTCFVFFLSLSFLVAGSLMGASLRVGAIAPTFPQEVKSVSQVRLEHTVKGLLSGYPMEDMYPYIVAQDKPTAAFLVGIAKKESNWGLRVPTKDGRDCYNYWGYRAPGSRGMAMGHGCFGSEAEAVATVSRRLDTFLYDFNMTTPQDLVVWKCGYSCAGHSPRSVQKWIADVDYYSSQVEEP